MSLLEGSLSKVPFGFMMRALILQVLLPLPLSMVNLTKPDFCIFNSWYLLNLTPIALPQLPRESSCATESVFPTSSGISLSSLQPLFVTAVEYSTSLLSLTFNVTLQEELSVRRDLNETRKAVSEVGFSIVTGVAERSPRIFPEVDLMLPKLLHSPLILQAILEFLKTSSSVKEVKLSPVQRIIPP